MKKRLLCMMLTLAMVASMVVMPVSAQTDGNITDTSRQCPCGCGPLSQADWKPYNMNEASASPLGHYYLEDDYAQKEQLTIISESEMIIDLRGHTLTTSGYSRLFLVEGYLAVLDTVGGGRFQSKTSGTALGGVIMVRMNETNGSTFELFSGTVTVDLDSKGSSAGGLIYLSGDKSTFRMYGGVLRDGKTNDLEGKNVYGGAIAAVTSTAEIDIRGGTILNCHSASYGGAIYTVGTTKLENCRIINCSAVKAGGAILQSKSSLTIDSCQIMSCKTNSSGGAIYTSGSISITDSAITQCTAEANGGSIYQTGGSLTTENCEIAYGTANGTGGGGNIYVTGSAVFTDTGSTIRDGYAHGGTGNGGGNILFGADTNNTLTGTTVKGGVSQKYGANILNWSATTTRLIDCNIDGDVRWAGAGLSLEGKTKIGLRSNGLNLVGGSAGSVISASKLTDGAEIFVSAHWGVFTNDVANLDYFKPALRTILSEEADGKLSGVAAASGAEGGYCPHCYDPENPQKVTWQSYTSAVDTTISQSGHYYLSKACTARFNIAADTDVVIDLNGLNITSGHRCFVLKAGASLSLLDFIGTGKVTGKGGITTKADGSTTLWSGGVIYGEGTCNLNVYGGTYTYTSQEDKHIAAGGVIHVAKNSNVNILGGTFDGSSFNKPDEGYVGGAISIANGTSSLNNKLNISAGRIIGGNAYKGGAIGLNNYCDARITGGMICGGTAVTGGNISAIAASGKRGTLTMRSCAVADGVATTNMGGNIVDNYYTISIEDCYIANGTSQQSNAGNFAHSYGSKDTITNSCIVGGTAIRGGNAYVATTDAVATYTNCQILAGEAVAGTGSAQPGSGGNVRSNNGRLVIVGGELAFGTAAVYGGNAQVNSGSVSLTDHPSSSDDGLFFMADKEKGIPAPLVTDGYAKTGSGGNLYVNGIAELTDARICAGRAAVDGQDIYLNSYSARTSLTIGAGVTGNVRLGVVDAYLGTPVYGNPIGHTVADKLNSNVILESIGVPVFSHSGNLFVGSASVVNGAGEETWYVDNAAAVAACGNEEYVKLYTANDLVLDRELTVDLNGQTVAISGNGKLSGMDSSGDGYTLPTGKATWTEAPNTAPIARTVDYRNYLPVTEGNSVTYHRLGMALTDIVLRPEDAGICYQGSWSCNEVLKERISEYGIVTSLSGMPGADFRSDESCISASFQTAIENGKKQCNVLVKDILQDGNDAETNNANGQTPIYATAYVTLTDGTTFVSDQPGVEDDVHYSLHEFMDRLDMLIASDPTNFRPYEKRMKEFYAKWETKGLADWKFNRLQAPVDPTSDNEFNVLLIGNSFCSYFVQELWGMLDAAGYENVHIYNVYYSGCWVEWHYNWWKQGKSNYSVNDSNSLVRQQVSNVASLEYCLSLANWDAISLQESSGAIRSTGKALQGLSSMELNRDLAVEQHFAKISARCDELLDYLHSEFPQARIFWHQTWAHQIGYDRDGYAVLDAAQQAADMKFARDFALKVCQQNDYLERIPSGEAWQVCREKYGYDNLCARLGKGTDHEGDYYHDGDIGGGQLLNASVWYEIITGLDCRENSFVPSYEYNGQVVPNRFDQEMIQNAAHEAVAAMRAGQ